VLGVVCGAGGAAIFCAAASAVLTAGSVVALTASVAVAIVFEACSHIFSAVGVGSGLAGAVALSGSFAGVGELKTTKNSMLD
jgi:hypothetical protein